MKKKTLAPFRNGTYLAFDTSTEFGSVCVLRNKMILDSICFSGRGRHSADLLLKIEEVISRQGLVISDVEGILVGEGPGSFTGVRVAAATAKGLCHSLEIPLWAISSLRAGAMSMEDEGMTKHPVTRCILFDARGNRVYAASYRAMSPGRLETIMPPHSTTIEGILSHCELPTVFAGDGAQRHSDQIREAGFQVADSLTGMPSAKSLCLAVKEAENDFRINDISAWEPQYLRVSSAERLRKQMDD